MKKNYELLNKDYNRVVIKERSNNSFQYFELSSEINYSTMKIEKMNYRLMSHESDNLARWESEERAAWYVSVESITAAQKLLKSNLTKFKKDIKNGCNHPAYDIMLESLNLITKHYKNDFLVHDSLQLGTKDFNIKFVWIVRECGTWLFYGQDTWSDTIINSLNKGNEPFTTYYYNGSRLISVSLEKGRELLSNMK